jgi:flagellar motor switch protein FliN/FliY
MSQDNKPENATPPRDPVAPEFGELGASVGATDPAALSMLYDLSLPITIELGRARMSVEELLGLGRGSVIQLDRLAGEPIDVFVGDRRFAEGEVVVVGEQFAVRVTRILGASPIAAAGAKA